MAEHSSLVKPETSIVIRVRDEGGYLQSCLDALRTQTYQDFEIICIYDKRSNDNTLEIAKANKLVVYEIDTFSFGRALNLGCSHAKGSYVVFVSAHALPVDSAWLYELIRPIKADSRIGGTFSRQLPLDDARPFVKRIMAATYPAAPEEARVVFSNSSSAIRKGVWTEVMFDEHLSGAEDCAWALEVMRRGHQIMYCPRSVVRHSHNESFAQVNQRAFREMFGFLEFGYRKADQRAVLREYAKVCKNTLQEILRLLSFQDTPMDLKSALAYHFGFFAGNLRAYRHFKETRLRRS